VDAHTVLSIAKKAGRTMFTEMVSAKRLDAQTVELASKRNGTIVSVSRLSVDPDGSSIHAVFENKESGDKSAFDFEKQK
jgi:hypothetical protein